MSRRNSVLGDVTNAPAALVMPPMKAHLSSATSTPLVSPVVQSLSATPIPQIDPCTVPEYSNEIIELLLMREKLAPRDGYLEAQTEITERMRQILIDWLIDVHLKFKLHPETFYLSVDIVDRYLAKKQVTRAQLQLVGITAVLIAAKHEEIWPPEVKDCVYISANTYSAAEVLAMERDVASTLRFRFTVPTAYPIMCRMLDTMAVPEVIRHAAFYFLDTAAHDYRLIQCLPSRVASAALLLARMTVARNSVTLAENADPESFWGYEQVACSYGITFDEIAPIAQQLLLSAASLTSASSRLQAVRRKYLSQKQSAVASLELPPYVIPQDASPMMISEQ